MADAREIENTALKPATVLEVVIKNVVGHNVEFETQIALDKFTPTGWGRMLGRVVADIAAWMPGDDEAHRQEMLHALVENLASIPRRRKNVI